jgi:hypothetical protein
MVIENLRSEEEDGEISKMYFNVERRELREIVGEINEGIKGLSVIDKSKAIRQKKTNPVIKTGRNDKVYFRWDSGAVRVNLDMAKDEVKDFVVDFLQRNEAAPGQSRHAADEDEMGMGDKKREREKRQRAREESDHRSETQREPRGSQGEAKSGKAKIDGDYTCFIPPFEKQEVDYKGPSEGDKPHLDCKDCVHYIKGGGCHMVQGEIDKDGYCEDLYSDMGIFARIYNGEFEINLALWGEMFDDRFGRISLQKVGESVREAISRKL